MVKLPDWRRLVRHAARFVGVYEKVLLAILAVVIIISGGFWYRQFTNNNSDSPTVGGTYVEGMVADKKELTQIITRLTKTGLLAFSADGQLEGQLAPNWSGSDDKLEYRFTLEQGIDRNEIISVLQQRNDTIGMIDVRGDLDHDVIIKLTTPNPSFPLLMTLPLFDYGPYKLGKSNDQTTVFTRNTRKRAVTAYINKIIIHSYANDTDLQKALRNNRLDGAVLATNAPMKNFRYYKINHNRYYAILFNINKSPFREEILRQALVSGETASALPFTLTTADEEPYRTLASEIVAKWQKQGARVELDLKSLEEVTDSIAPTRNFQALLVGLDYGLEMDPFYLWHSSQILATGNNVTGIKNQTIDMLVEKTRANLNYNERQKLLDELQTTLTSQGVAIFLKRESVDYYISNKILFVPPSLPSASADRFLSVALWSVK